MTSGHRTYRRGVNNNNNLTAGEPSVSECRSVVLGGLTLPAINTRNSFARCRLPRDVLNHR
ncbi:hypothetical protein J6590_004993 [Homalodisca vitripennis]|nr:hypothetical protein J6590_004993 [Homalodisca vitripennis]